MSDQALNVRVQQREDEALAALARIEAEAESNRLEAVRWRREADAALESEKRIAAERDRLREQLKTLEYDIENVYKATNLQYLAERDQLREAAAEHLAACMTAGRTQDNLRRALEGRTDG